jgi:hypothetical protein
MSSPLAYLWKTEGWCRTTSAGESASTPNSAAAQDAPDLEVLPNVR